MPPTSQPSYTDLVYEALQGADQPLTFAEIIAAVQQRRPITTRDPKATIRNALGQSKQLASLGDGRYWYLPHCVRGSVLRVVLTEKKPANHPISIDDEVRQALWPSFFEAEKRRSVRPMRARLPTGDEVDLTLGSNLRGRWATPIAEPLRRYLVEQRASAGDSLLVRVLDADEGRGEAWLEPRQSRPKEAIAARNQELADAAYTFIRRRNAEQTAIWDIAIALLARGLYRAEVPPDPLRAVLRADRRFEFPQIGWLGFDEESASFVAIRDEPPPAESLPPPDSLYQIKVTLRGIEPPIWRRLLVPAGMRLSTLHRVLQIAMGWDDDHLHQFVVGRRRVIGAPAPYDWRHIEDERAVRLLDVAPGARSRLRYEYDFGDRWAHDILVEKVLPPSEDVVAPVCIAGARACPPEDVGGSWGYAHFLEVLKDPSRAEHDEMLEWIGGDFDAEAFDLDAVNARLRPLARTVKQPSRERPWARKRRER